jgi:hypothetical protein
MATFLPDAERLVLAAADFLEEQLLPTLGGHHRFHTRVCANVLRTVARELQQAGELERGEHRRLCELLAREGPLEALNGELAQRIASGAMPLDTPGLLEHLRATLKESLEINNPNWAVQT